MGTLLIIVLILLLIGGLPNWNFHSYGNYPSGLAGVLLVVVIVLVLMRVIT